MSRKISVAVLLYDRVNAIDVTGPVEVFATAKGADGVPAYSIITWSIGASKQVVTESGLTLQADRSAPQTAHADILIVPGGEGIREGKTLSEVSDWLSANRNAFGQVVSICTGAYALAEAGFFDDQIASTHWAHAADLQSKYPSIQVDADALFVRGPKVSSSGGVTAGIDLALDLVQEDLGEHSAMAVARELVVYLRRPGAQAQFSLPLQLQSKSGDKLNEVCLWAAANLAEDLTVETLAHRAGLSARQFSRRFQQAYDTPPATFIKILRLDEARQRLGQGVSIKQTAQSVGFASIDGFRKAFEQRFGLGPRDYQKHFRERKVG